MFKKCIRTVYLQLLSITTVVLWTRANTISIACILKYAINLVISVHIFFSGNGKSIFHYVQENRQFDIGLYF